MSFIGDAGKRITHAFNDYFANFGIRIAPGDMVAGARRTIRDERSGWAITYRVDADTADTLALEFYATNRRTNDRHVLISADGELEGLEAISETVSLGPANAVEEFESSNEAIAARLRDWGDQQLRNHSRHRGTTVAGRDQQNP